MVVTNKLVLPSEEELNSVKELPLGTPYLKAGAMHLGKQCEAQNNEFMLCRTEHNDPRKCLEDGKAVTNCATEFFKKIKGSCAAEFTQYAMCLERSSKTMRLKHCRKTQHAFDDCVKRNFGWERPDFGYLSLAKVHNTTRPKPEEERPAYLDDPRGKPLDALPKDFPRDDDKYGEPGAPEYMTARKSSYV